MSLLRACVYVCVGERELRCDPIPRTGVHVWPCMRPRQSCDWTHVRPDRRAPPLPHAWPATRRSSLQIPHKTQKPLVPQAWWQLSVCEGPRTLSCGPAPTCPVLAPLSRGLSSARQRGKSWESWARSCGTWGLLGLQERLAPPGSASRMGAPAPPTPPPVCVCTPLPHCHPRSSNPRPGPRLLTLPSARPGGADGGGRPGGLPAAQPGAAGTGAGAAVARAAAGPPGVRLPQVSHPLQPR